MASKLLRKKTVEELTASATPLKRTMKTFDLTMLGMKYFGSENKTETEES